MSPAFTRSIVFTNLKFGYGDKILLNCPDIEVKAKNLTVFIGPSGAGKTTIVDLITGLLRPQEGDVWVDDHPLGELDLGVWRKMLGYVPQEPVLFNDSIRANIVLGDTHLGDVAIENALRSAGLWETVSQLPEGMDAQVGERGARFSGGQRQRLALARALVRTPQLLILDEATSSLDIQSEEAVLDTIRGLRGEITMLAISHRSNFSQIADTVYEVRDGEITLVKGAQMKMSYSKSWKE